jgi:dolichol-phosphate mannosyltransferase
MSRRVVEVLCAMPERQRFLRGMVSWVGGRQVPLPYERQARLAGVSKYPLARMLRFAVDALTSFSTSPLRVATWFGLGAAGLAVLLLAYALLRWVQGGTVTGWSSLMAAMAGFGAAQLIVLGIIGEYLGRLFQEVKGRPLFLVDQVLAGQAQHELPTDFARLPPRARQQTWDAIRAANSNEAASRVA